MNVTVRLAASIAVALIAEDSRNAPPAGVVYEIFVDLDGDRELDAGERVHVGHTTAPKTHFLQDHPAASLLRDDRTVTLFTPVHIEGGDAAANDVLAWYAQKRLDDASELNGGVGADGRPAEGGPVLNTEPLLPPSRKRKLFADAPPPGSREGTRRQVTMKPSRWMPKLPNGD